MSGVQKPQSYNDEKTLRVSHVSTGKTQVAKNFCLISYEQFLIYVRQFGIYKKRSCSTIFNKFRDLKFNLIC